MYDDYSQPNDFGGGYIPDWVPLIGTKEKASEAVASVEPYVPSAVSEHVQSALAAAGVPAGPDAYKNVPTKMFVAVNNTLDAYEQAVFWLSFASRRAAFEKNVTGAALLQQTSDTLWNDWEDAEEQAGWACKSMGYACPTRNAMAVLADAGAAIEAAGLPEPDTLKILTVLNRSWRAAAVKRSLPFIGLGILGVALGTWWYRS